MNRPLTQTWVEKYPCCYYGTDLYDTIWAWNYAEEFPLTATFKRLLQIKFWGTPTQKVARVYGVLENGTIRVTVRDLNDIIYETGISTDSNVFMELPLNKLMGSDGVIVVEGRGMSETGYVSLGLFKEILITIGSRLSNCFWVEKLPVSLVWSEAI